jgi:cyclopropane fatty-acyl-phospholipid synthase-like methyltransferase
MSELTQSRPAFFEAMYRRKADPWNFEHNEYERNRYRSILRALEDTRWKVALEPGCSVGVLTEGLAPQCERLLALDFSATAADIAQARCSRFTQVQVLCSGLEDVESFSNFDLIVLSEIGYYFTDRNWAELTERMVEEIQPGATILAAHWTGHSDDHQISGDRVHEILMSHSSLKIKLSEFHEGFRLERLERS